MSNRLESFSDFMERELGLNEVKISQGQAMNYFNIIKRYLGSKTMDTEFKGTDTLLVKFDNITLVFKDMYLAGFEEDGEYYEVSRSLKSVKELKNVRNIGKFFGRQVNSIKEIKKPKEVIYSYFPESKKELKDLVLKLIKERGIKANLNDIDVSNVTNMSNLFEGIDFNGDISKWNVSNVKDMRNMFSFAKIFDQDLSKWNVSNVTNMRAMFKGGIFNQDISKWNISNVKDISFMFNYAILFDQDLSKWNVSNVEEMTGTFENSPLDGNEPNWYIG